MESMVVEYEASDLNSLLEQVYQHGGYDFRNYKRGTVIRRLARKLHATGTKTYPEYMRFLETHPDEYQKLADYITIKASGFFRSPYTFQQISGLMLPELLSYKETHGERSLRLWSTACARGEEPYSIAILLADFFGQQQREFDVTIYASDISYWALGEAQTGIYSQKDIEGLSPEIKQNYFSQRNQHIEVRDDIRQMVSFCYFDLASAAQPPFMNLDCIFCCNVLIYLQRQLQEQVISMLYDALATPGYLVLGEAETPAGSCGEKLECLDSKARIYRKVI